MFIMKKNEKYFNQFATLTSSNIVIVEFLRHLIPATLCLKVTKNKFSTFAIFSFQHRFLIQSIAKCDRYHKEWKYFITNCERYSKVCQLHVLFFIRKPFFASAKWQHRGLRLEISLTFS